MAKLGVSELRNPRTIVTNFGVGDYVDDMTSHAKIQTDRHNKGVEANR